MLFLRFCLWRWRRAHDALARWEKRAEAAREKIRIRNGY